MAQSETVTIGEKKFTATVLTVKQVREVLQQVEAKDYKAGLIDMLFEDGLPEPAFYAALGIEETDIEELTPEDVKELMEAVAKVNPSYAGMEKRMSAKEASFANLQAQLSSLKEIVSTSSK